MIIIFSKQLQIQVTVLDTNNLYNYMVSSIYSYLIIIVCLHKVTWFQVFLSNTNNFQKYILGHRWNSKKGTTPGQNWPDHSKGELEPYHLLQFNVIPWTQERENLNR